MLDLRYKKVSQKRCTVIVIWKLKNWFWMSLQICSLQMGIYWCGKHSFFPHVKLKIADK
jgi:hypothetical protein